MDGIEEPGLASAQPNIDIITVVVMEWGCEVIPAHFFFS